MNRSTQVRASVDKDGDGNPLPGQQELSDTSDVAEGSTMTKSVVAHLPWDIGGTRWSAHWNTSENFFSRSDASKYSGCRYSIPFGRN